MIRGYQTSEFWITLGTLVTTLAGALFQALPAKYAAIAMGITVFGYAVSRGLAKSASNPNPDPGS